MTQLFVHFKLRSFEYMKKHSRFVRLLITLNVFILLVISSGSTQDLMSLDDCIHIVLKNNHDIRNAERQVAIARTLKTSAVSAYYPSLSAGLSSSQTRVAPQINNKVVYQGIELGAGSGYESPGFITKNYSVGATITQLLFDGGTSINLIKQENANVEAALTAEKDTRSNIVLECKRLYYGIKRLEEQLRVARESYDSTVKQLSQIELLMTRNSVPQMDVYRARVARNNAQILLLSLEPQIESAVAEFNILMGRSADSPLRLNQGREEVHSLSYTLDDAINYALDNNTDLTRIIHKKRQCIN